LKKEQRYCQDRPSHIDSGQRAQQLCRVDVTKQVPKTREGDGDLKSKGGALALAQ
jgi:hypothetical protein